MSKEWVREFPLPPISKETIDDIIKSTIAARDKWWVDKMELHHDFTALGHTPPQIHFIFSEPEWQQLKREVGQ